MDGKRIAFYIGIEMNQYNFDKALTTVKYTVGIDSNANYGYFQNDITGTEGGLWFNSNKELTDYDGVFELPNEVILMIESLGFNADYAKDSE